MLSSLGLFRNNISELNKVQYKDQGIPAKDLLALLHYVQKKRAIVIFRPVEVNAKSLHEAGYYPTKDFNIKGKSSSWGPWSGFIPIDQAYSKLVGAKPEKIETANKDVQACIQHGHAIATHLKITEKRFMQLLAQGIIKSQELNQDEFILLECPIPHTKTSALCYAQKVNTESGIEYTIYTAEKTPFQVLADTHLKRPLIPDFDLLAVIVHWSDFGPAHLRPNGDIIREVRLRKLSPRARCLSIENEINFLNRETPNLGNVTPETKEKIAEMNKVLDKGLYLDCIHHSDDVGSPFSDPSANYPMTALLPELEGFDSNLLFIPTKKEFVDLIRKIIRLGYLGPANPLWEPEVQLIAKIDFLWNMFLVNYHMDKKSLESTVKKILECISYSKTATTDLLDSTLIKEISHVLSLIMKSGIDVELEIFFDTLQSCLSVNSNLITRCCTTLEALLNKKLLTNQTFQQILEYMNLFKESIVGFTQITEPLINSEKLNLEIMERLFNLTKTCIQGGKLNNLKFRTSWKNLQDELNSKSEMQEIMRPAFKR